MYKQRRPHQPPPTIPEHLGVFESINVCQQFSQRMRTYYRRLFQTWTTLTLHHCPICVRQCRTEPTTLEVRMASGNSMVPAPVPNHMAPVLGSTPLMTVCAY